VIVEGKRIVAVRIKGQVMSRSCRCWVVLFSCCVMIATSSAAEWKPDKTVAITVGVAPGGALDVTARDMMRVLQNERLVSVPLTLVNRPGVDLPQPACRGRTFHIDQRAEPHAR
jgi:hypothetical protein